MGGLAITLASTCCWNSLRVVICLTKSVFCLRVLRGLRFINEDSSGHWDRRRDCSVLLHTNPVRNGSVTPSSIISTELSKPHCQGYIHGEGVCHRDLKPENIMLDVAGVLKISDFGLCSVYKLKESGKTRLLSERCGSLPYIAPEVSFSDLSRRSEVSPAFKAGWK